MMMKQKDFGTALLVWFFLGGFGGHRIYIQDSIKPLFYYWLLVICTLTIIVWVDLFTLKGKIQEANEKELIRNKVLYGKDNNL